MSAVLKPEKKKLFFEAKNLSKVFDRKTIFREINFSLSNSGSLAVTGRNGSGKSTLIKILINLLTPSSGETELRINDSEIERIAYYKHIGLVSPYLNLYDEFSAAENLKIASAIRGNDSVNHNEILNRVGLYTRRNDPLKIYSSGMKQRAKIAFAILHNPDILLLDEPTSNLDASGINLVDNIAEEYKQNRILIIATNDEHERALCSGEINLNSF